MYPQTTSASIHIRERFFWKGNSRFFVRGVVYQVYEMVDPISDDRLSILEHDILLFKELGINTIFVYSIDNTKTHDECMDRLHKAGIYVFTTVSTRSHFIFRETPYKSYHSAVIESFFKTVDIMANYPNTLGLAVSNGSILRDDHMNAAAVVKAVVRDLKEYMRLKNGSTGQRILPLCYSAANSDTRDIKILDYLLSGDGPSSIDFWTCKNLTWTGHTSVEQSEMSDLIDHLSHVTVPVFFSEYGSTKHRPRQFEHSKALFSAPMSQVFSGGCVYEFWNTANAYGLVETPGHVPPPFLPFTTRTRDESQIAERRTTNRGPMVLFHDFFNYKSTLESTRGMESNWDNGSMPPGVTHGESASERQMDQSWKPEFPEPECCVDWERIRELVKTGDAEQFGCD